MTHRRRTSRRRAFTLVETIATLAIIGVVSLAVSRLLYTATDAYSQIGARADLANQMSLAMDRMVIELRRIDSTSSSGAVGPSISAFTASQIDFVSGGSSFTLAYNSGTQTVAFLGAAGVTSTLMPNVSSFTITPLNAVGTAIATPVSAANLPLIRSIRIQMTCSNTTLNISEILRTQIYIRSMMVGSGAP
jgi:prepilin-type N-terminal cleavage/methylation domain-containing protein